MRQPLLSPLGGELLLTELALSAGEAQPALSVVPAVQYQLLTGHQPEFCSH